MRKFEVMHIQGHQVRIEDEYICISDMAKAKAGQLPADVINNWLRAKPTVDFLGWWETINNPKQFKVAEFHHFGESSNYANLSVKEWVDKTKATGIYSKAGNNGGTFAHKDIAFEFGTYVSTPFKLFLITEFQKMKEAEASANSPEWTARRYFSKNNYTVQTDAVKFHKIPNLSIAKIPYAYSEEGDILNLALFGFTAKQWREHNLSLAAKGQNVREYASTNELAVLSTLEGMNAEMIKSQLPYKERLAKLTQISKEQLAVLDKAYPQNSLKRNTKGNFQPFFKNDTIGMFPVQPIELTA